MSGKMYLHLLFILCGIFSHVIMTSSEENIGKSSDFLIRKKRVLNHEPGADVPVRIRDFPYVVQVKRFNRMHCVGSILSHRTVITAATCISIELASYKVSSGVIRTSGGQAHNVTGFKTYFSSNSPRNVIRDGIALLTIDPPFVYNPYTINIGLHEEVLLPNTIGIVAGWGFLATRKQHGTQNRETLRAITVPIMNHRDCVNIYRDFANITDAEICTFDANKHCGHTDVGAALVVQDKLAGIHLWGGQIATSNKPDVFALVQHLELSSWIRANIV